MKQTTKPGRVLPLGLALATILQAQAAAAADCLSEAEVGGMVVYAMPTMLESVSANCSAHLPADGFLAANGGQLAERYRALGDANWPLARSAMIKFAAAKKDGEQPDPSGAAMLAALPDEALRPLIDAIVAQKLGEAIKPASCGRIERGIRIVAPLPPENTGELVGFIMGMVKPKDPQECPLEPTVSP